VSHSDVIVGKFAAGVVMTGAMLLPTLAYPVSIAFIGDLDWGPVIGGYIGALLLGGAFSAVGLFSSAVTHNQIVAFIIGAAICFTLTLLDKLLFFFPETVINVIEYLGADFHFRNISKGIIDSRDILYFVSLMFIALYLTYLSLLKKE
jgi:ABC-2 type transport system permease protein